MNHLLNKRTQFIDLGLIGYQEAWDYQTALFNKTLDVKALNRQRAEDDQLPTENYLIFCEHPHVYTLGKSGDQKNLLVSVDKLPAIGATYHHINRGGDITYHGPGQLVVYPVLDLENFFTDIHRYMRLLEESVIQTMAHYGLTGERIEGLTGVWMGKKDQPRKISALGVKMSRWVTMHGLSFNIHPQLSYFNHIVPCGIQDKTVTSMEQESGKKPNMDEVKQMMKANIFSLFEMTAVTDPLVPVR